MLKWRGLLRVNSAKNDGSGGACGVGDCTCLVPTLGDLQRHLLGTDRQDSTGAARHGGVVNIATSKIIFFGPQYGVPH